MLQFIFGLPFSGKTGCILEKVSEVTQNNEKAVVIVPEQASFETEKTFLKALGDSFSLNVQVLSFSRLYDEVSQKFGGLCAKVLTGSDKIIFMNRALKQVAPELKLWRKYANSLNFAKTMLDTVGEFKISGITAQNIKNASLLTESIALQNKLLDLALIYETFDALIFERFIDPADNLSKLYLQLENYNFFENKTVFFDGFKGFTGQQFKIIDRVLTQAKNVYFSFTNNGENAKEFDIFSNIRLAVSRIEKIAKLHNVEITKPIILNKTNFNSKSIKNLEKLLSDNPISEENDDTLTICECKTVFDEAEVALSTIRKLVRTKNFRYRDFAIISRDNEKYAQAVEYSAKKNKVDCFLDKKLPLSSFPLSIAALSAIKSLNFSTEKILRFYKSGINYLSIDEISKLENYTYLWNIDGYIWLDEWDMDVRGFVTEEESDYDKNSLIEINNIRKKALKPLEKFKQNFVGNAFNKSKALLELLEECNATAALKDMCEKFSSQDFFTRDALNQGYDAFMKVLDSLVNCFTEKSLTNTEYYDALSLALSLETISVIPQTIDQVIFGQADTIRLSSPKILFVLGANQGVFPKYSENNSLFAISERKKLIDLGLDITDNQIYDSIDENYLVYSNLTACSDELYISYSTQTLKGESLTASSFVTSIKEKLNPKIIKDDSTVLPETADSGLSEFCRRISQNQDYSSLKEAINLKTSNNLTNIFLSAVSGDKKAISKESANALYGENIYMSATKFDTFKRCKFSFFCKYGMRIKKLQPADFDVLQRGTIVHYVLEKIISTYKENIKDFTKQQLDDLCEQYINEYLDLVSGYRSVQTARHSFLISKISRSLKEVVYQLSREFAQSEFKPTHCELKIGGKDGIPLNFDYSNGKIFVNGSIDRVDEYNGLIRIVDYKTGSKSFKLPDVLFGLNLQMLIYLYAVIRADNRQDKDAVGILYMPSKRDLNNDGMAMNGLLKGDIDIIAAMEKENRGEFVPYLPINKDGSISKTANSFIKEEDFSKIFDYIENLMTKTGDTIANGEIEISPVDGRESSACDYCDFKAICGNDSAFNFKVPNLKNDEVFINMGKGENNGSQTN